MNGEQKLALSGAFGSIGFGAINNSALVAHGTSQPFGTAIGSGFVGPTGGTNGKAGIGNTGLSGSVVTASVRSDNSFEYASPVFMGGWSAAYIYRAGINKTALNDNYSTIFGAQQQGQFNDLSIKYSAGPLNAILSRVGQDQQPVNTPSATGATTFGSKGTFTMLAGNYTLGATTLYAGLQTNNATNGAVTVLDRKTTNIAAKHVMGANTLLANYARAKVGTSTSATANFDGQGSSLLGLGYEYALSKTAALTARYDRISDDAKMLLTTGLNVDASLTTRTRVGLGFRLNF